MCGEKHAVVSRTIGFKRSSGAGKGFACLCVKKKGLVVQDSEQAALGAATVASLSLV